MKAKILATGECQDLVDQPIADVIEPTDIMFSQYRPVELKNDLAVKKFRADLKKGGLTGSRTTAPTSDTSPTWRSRAFEEAGPNPTRQGFVDGILQSG